MREVKQILTAENQEADIALEQLFARRKREYAILTENHTDADTESIPVVTSFSSLHERDRDHALKSGANAFVVEPWSMAISAIASIPCCGGVFDGAKNSWVNSEARR